MSGTRDAFVFASAVALIAMVVAAGAVGSVAPLPGSGEVGPVDEPPLFADAAFGYANVTADLYNVSVSSVTFGPYALNGLATGNRTVIYSLACFGDSCSVGFWVINDTAFHDYVASVNSAYVTATLSNGELVSGRLADGGGPVVEPLPGPNGGIVAEEWVSMSPGGVVASNMAVVPLNATDSSPVVQVTVGGRTISSSYFSRQSLQLPQPNGTAEVLEGPLELHGPIVYYIMQEAGRTVPVTVTFEDGRQTSLALPALSIVFSYLRG